jgi:hypothetical protein
MCGITVSNKNIQCLDCSKLKRQRPDKRTHVEVNGIHLRKHTTQKLGFNTA